MEKVTVSAVNDAGLHARPVSLLTKLVKNFDCEIGALKNGIRAQKEAVRAIEDFILNGCGE